jgi:hypothetical protein
MSPEDILGGDQEPSVVERAKKIRKEGSTESIADVLKQARLEVDQAAKDIIAHVEASSQPFDPFRVFGIHLEETAKYTHEVGYRACSPQQHFALTNLGVKPEALEGMSRIAAKKLLAEFVRRRQQGLCTFRQLEILQKHGVRDRFIFMARATEAIDYLKQTGWGKHTDQAKLLEICRQPRQSGEEG